MFKKLFGRKSESEIVAKYRKDNEALMARVASLEIVSQELKETLVTEGAELAKEKCRNAELAARVEELESDNSKAVTYASGRKVMTKAKLKSLRAQLEAVPEGASGFGGSVSVYNKKTKRLSIVELKSKAQALELVSKAEKGNVDIIV
jgi:hypothetical protein